MPGPALISDFTRLSSNNATGLVVACSGGLDSIALLHGLATSTAAQQHPLRAIHVHHGLHADADAWAAHCQQVCDALKVPLRIVQVDVSRDGGAGLEAAARRARHAAFEAELAEAEVIALAHHRDDQAETFLLRALRASGPDGLAAMRPWRTFGRGWLWRPLLDTPRAALLAYAQQHGLQWIDDPSNTDTAFDRNFLRQQVMPLLRERWPHFDAAFAMSATLCADAGDLLREDDALALVSARTLDAHTLARDALRALPPARRARVLRLWIATLGLPPLPAEGVARIETDLLDARPDAEPEFAWRNAIVRGWRNQLHADWQRAALPTDFEVSWDGRGELRLPTGDHLALVGAASAATLNPSPPNPPLEGEGFKAVAAEAAPTFARQFIVRARTGGERITLPGRTHSHALKHVLQELGVPPWVRERLPLLADVTGTLLAAGDLVYSATFDAWLRQHSARLQWTPSQDR